LFFQKPAPLKLITSDLTRAIVDMGQPCQAGSCGAQCGNSDKFHEALEPILLRLATDQNRPSLNILVNALDATLPGDYDQDCHRSAWTVKVDVIIQDSGQGTIKRSSPKYSKPFLYNKNTWIGAGTRLCPSASSGTIQGESRSGAKLKKAQSS